MANPSSPNTGSPPVQVRDLATLQLSLFRRLMVATLIVCVTLGLRDVFSGQSFEYLPLVIAAGLVGLWALRGGVHGVMAWLPALITLAVLAAVLAECRDNACAVPPAALFLPVACAMATLAGTVGQGLGLSGLTTLAYLWTAHHFPPTNSQQSQMVEDALMLLWVAQGMSVLFAFGFGRMQQGLDRRRQVLLSLDAENRDLAEHLFERLAQSMGELESLLAAPATDAAALGAPVEGIQLALGQARDTALRPLPSGADLAASDPVERVRLGFIRLGAWIAAGAVMLVPLLAWRGGFWSTQSSVNLAAGLLMLAYMALVGPLRRPQVTVWFLFSAEFTVLCQGVLTWDHGALSPNLMEAPVLVVLVGLAVGNLSAAVVAGLGALLAALDWGLGPRAMLRVNQDFDLGVGLFFALFAAGQLLDLHRQMGREMARVLEGLEGRINHRRRLMGFLFHDMMTPLSLLTMSLEGTELDLDPAARPRFLGEVRRLARKFAVARPFVLAASAVEAPRSVFKLAPLLEELKAASHGALLAKGLQLYLDCPAGLEVESVAEVLSGSVLAHLLNNAIQFTPPGGAVVLRAEALAGGLARLQVLDQGPGFKPQTLEALHAGGPAARIHQALGLALAQDYAQRLGGRLELVNQLNGGGEARLFLPLAGA